MRWPIKFAFVGVVLAVVAVGLMPGCELSATPEQLQKYQSAADVASAAVEVQSAAAETAVAKSEEASALAERLASLAASDPANAALAAQAREAKSAADRVQTIAREQVSALAVSRAAMQAAQTQLTEARTTGKISVGTIVGDTLTVATAMIPGNAPSWLALLGVGVAAYQKIKRNGAETTVSNQSGTIQSQASNVEFLQSRLAAAKAAGDRAGAALASVVNGIDAASAADSNLNNALKANKVLLDNAYTPDAISMVSMGVMANGEPAPGTAK